MFKQLHSRRIACCDGLGEHDDHAVPTKCLLSVGLGLLFSACLSVVGRAGDAFWSSEMPTAAFFFLGMCSGAFLTCVVGFVAVLVVSHKNLSQKLGRLCMTLVLLVGLVCSELGSCLHVMFDNMYLIVGWIDMPGLLVGIGCCAMALCWVILYANLTFIEALRYGTLALVLGVVGYGVVDLLISSRFLPVAIAGYFLVSASCCIILILSAHHVFQSSACAGSASSPLPDGCAERKVVLHRGRTLLRMVWAPLCGLLVCAFLLGVLWTQAIPGLAEGEGIDWIGPLVVALILSVRARHIQDYESARRMFWLIIPFAALLFLVTPHFDASATGLSSIVVTNLQNASSVALLVCLWSLLLTASRTTGLSAVETFGVCFALITAAPIVGYVLYSLLGTVANTIAVIFFDLYTCATVIFLVLVGPDERESREVALNAIDAYIGPRCAALSAEYGLTARESEILLFLARGHSYSYVAESIYVSETTVRTHARNLYRKMGVGSQEDLIQLIDSAQGV